MVVVYKSSKDFFFLIELINIVCDVILGLEFKGQNERN